MMNITLRVAARATRRWHLILAQALQQQGHSLAVEYVEIPENSSFSIDYLRKLEQNLYSANAVRAGERVSADLFSSFAGLAAAPGVILDCTGDRTAGAGVILQPVFENCLDHNALVTALAALRSPEIGWRRVGDGALLTSGRTATTTPHALTFGYDEACSRLVSLALKAVRLLETQGAAASPVVAVEKGAPGPALFAHAAGAFAGRVTERIMRPFVRKQQWTVGWRRIGNGVGLVESAACRDAPFQWFDCPPDRFIADPFPIAHNGVTYVFVEEFPYSTGKGIISVFEVAADGAPSALKPVLERPCHLSYPNVFELDGAIWMIPETSGNRTIELYRPDPFPDRWVLEAVLVENILAADATLFRHEGLWWMSATTSEYGSSSWDGMSLFYAEKMTGPWTPHPLNPVIVDVRSARPGGWITPSADGLRRPAQDCSLGYGMGMAINRIDRLDRETYAETVLARLSPPPAWEAAGFHTINRLGDFEVVDALR